MFAVVRTGGKQYRVAAGDKIAVEKIAGEAGDTVTLGDVLLAGDGGSLKAADGLTVSAEIIAQAKGEKVVVFKKRRRHNYRRKKGHRQQYTLLRITAVGEQQAEAPKRKAKAAPSESGTDALVASEAPLKVEGAESAQIDAPAEAKPAAETKKSRAKAEATAKTEGAESDQVDAPAPKKRATKKPASGNEA